jgi:hypothetical protein
MQKLKPTLTHSQRAMQQCHKETIKLKKQNVQVKNTSATKDENNLIMYLVRIA